MLFGSDQIVLEVAVGDVHEFEWVRPQVSERLIRDGIVPELLDLLFECVSVWVEGQFEQFLFVLLSTLLPKQ